jgi:hypothetical protein
MLRESREALCALCPEPEGNVYLGDDADLDDLSDKEAFRVTNEQQALLTSFETVPQEDDHHQSLAAEEQERPQPLAIRRHTICPRQ